MCGIIAYVGRHPAQPVLLEGLRRLEYRGYDGVGLATADSKGLHLRKWSPNGVVDLPQSSRCKNVVLAQMPAAGQVAKRPVTVTVRMSSLRS